MIMELGSTIILFMIFIVGLIVVAAGLLLVAIEAVALVWRRLFRR